MYGTPPINVTVETLTREKAPDGARRIVSQNHNLYQLSGFLHTSLELSDRVPAELGAYFANVRMGDWGGYILISILGYMLGLDLANGYFTNLLLAIPYFAVIACYLGFSFSINNCFDCEGDRL